MLKTIDAAVELVCVPIVRESDGLAMSSRNIRLSENGRAQALYLSKALFQAREDTTNFTLAQTKERANAYLIANGIDIDYLEITDGDTLQEIENWDASSTIVICATINVDGVRLLDNVLLKKDGQFLSIPPKPSLS
jgi:pantoate--beta-alanine ligase